MKILFLFLLCLPIVAETLTIDSGSPTDQFFVGGASDFTISYPGVTGDLSVRYGAFGYHIPRPPGFYSLTLTFRETGTVSAKNQRIFSVKVNGETKLDRLDLFATAGLDTKEFSYVVASNGFINIDFTYAIKSAIVSSIKVESIGGGSGLLTRRIEEPINVGTACQDGDYAAGAAPVSPVLGAPLYICLAGALRRFRADPEPWGNGAVSDLGGVLQMEESAATFPPVFYFRTNIGQMIGPFSFQGFGPVPAGLKFPVLIQPFPRAAAQ